MPHDRGGIMQFWIALVDCPPERGSLRFLTRSREAGPMGRVVAQARRRRRPVSGAGGALRGVAAARPEGGRCDRPRLSDDPRGGHQHVGPTALGAHDRHLPRRRVLHRSAAALRRRRRARAEQAIRPPQVPADRAPVAMTAAAVEFGRVGWRPPFQGAALADRITLGVGTAPERVRWALDRVHEGLAAAGRTRTCGSGCTSRCASTTTAAQRPTACACACA
jgi:hypothetical protein